MKIKKKKNIENTSVKVPFYKKKGFWIAVVILLIIGLCYPTDESNITQKDSISMEKPVKVEETTKVANENKKIKKEKVDEEKIQNKEKYREKEDKNKTKREFKVKEKSKVKKFKKMPIIEGSMAYDVIYYLDENGIPKPDTVTIENGYSWDSNTMDYAYHIESNKKNEISYCKFMVLRGNGKAFLKGCASLPYDKKEGNKAEKWVSTHIGKSDQIKIGDAIFILSKNNTGAVLEIKALERDAYIDYMIDKSMKE